MTKKTNSLLCRFGLSSFWKYKSVSHNNVANILQIENIFYKELLSKKLDLLIIKHYYNKIILFVYNRLQLNENYISQVVNYYKIFLSISKTIEKFSVSTNFLLLLLKINKNKLFLVKNYKRHFCNLIFYIKKYLFIKLCFLVKSLNIFKILYFNKSRLHLIFLYVLKLNTFKKTRRIFKKTIHNKKKLFKVNGFIKLQLFSIFLENICFFRIKQPIKVFFINVLLTKGFYKFSKTIKINKNYTKWEYRNLLFIIFLGSTYINSNIFSNYVAQALTKQKNHRKVLNFFVEFLEFFYFLNLVRFLGIQLRVNGKLGGKMRKSKYQYRLGKVQLQTIKLCLNYSLTVSYSKFGILSVKIWLLSGQKKL